LDLNSDDKTTDAKEWEFDNHIVGLLGPCFIISILVNVLFNVVAWICSLYTMSEKNELVGLDSQGKEGGRKDLQYTLFFGYLNNLIFKIRILIF